MKSGKTSTGFEYTINEKVLKDMEFAEILADILKGDEATVIASYPPLVTKLLGAEQKKKLYDFVRDQDGIVNIDDVSKVITEIMEQSKEIKNS